MKKYAWVLLLLTAMPLWAQKQLIPAASACGNGAANVARVLGKRTLAPVKVPKVSGPLSYVPPKVVDVKKLDQLSATVNRTLHLYRASQGTIRNLADLEAFAKSDAPARLRLQALLLGAQELTPSQAKLFFTSYPFLTTNTQFAAENNEWILRLIPTFKKQMEFIQTHRDEILSSLKITEMDRPHMVTAAIPASARLVMLGEVHNRETHRLQTARLLEEYRALHPGRKMVLLSEFLPSRHPQFWKPGQAIPKDFFEKNPEFSNEVYALGKRLDMDIYGLEDIEFVYQKMPQVSGLGLVEANTSFRGMVVRNKYWENLVRYVMDATKKKYPDAVFFVYAGNAHVNKNVAESLSANLKDQTPFVVEMQDGYQHGFLGFLLGKDPSVAAELPGPYLFSWKEGKNFSKVMGFDAQVVFPLEDKATVPVDQK